MGRESNFLKVRPNSTSLSYVFTYLKGKSAVNALLRENYKKSSARPPVEDRQIAEQLMNKLTKDGVFFQVDKVEKSKHLNIHQQLATSPPQFSQDAYYVWIYEGSQWRTYALASIVVLLILAGVMFPLWPRFMQTGVYYLSLGVLGLMGVLMVIVVIRLIIWVGLVLATGRGGWLFPNLFEDVGIIESFVPFWGWDEKKGDKKKKSEGSDGDDGSKSKGENDED
ncbi:Translocation protein S62 [Nowakowskiella sp. JEL0078]|nr:Translocation protein S62 [Nowakowskiella sp. JEL0078]